MAQFYSDPAREPIDTALPDAEVFYRSAKEMRSFGKDSVWYNPDDRAYLQPGWYYWYCFPGCLPDSDPMGPFATEAEAIEDARDQD